MDKITGFLEVGLNDGGEIVVNHPDLKPDENGVGHIVFSANQARNLARLLDKHADQSDRDAREKREAEAEAIRKLVEAARWIVTYKSGAIDTSDLAEALKPFTETPAE